MLNKLSFLKNIFISHIPFISAIEKRRKEIEDLRELNKYMYEMEKTINTFLKQ